MIGFSNRDDHREKKISITLVFKERESRKEERGGGSAKASGLAPEIRICLKGKNARKESLLFHLYLL